MSLFLQHLSWGSTDVPALWAEVTLAWEAATAVETACFAVVLVVETSAQKAAMTHDSVVAQVKDAEDRAALTEREAQERVSRVEVESAATQPSTREEIESLV
jgi:hypothetical protein